MKWFNFFKKEAPKPSNINSVTPLTQLNDQLIELNKSLANLKSELDNLNRVMDKFKKNNIPHDKSDQFNN